MQVIINCIATDIEEYYFGSASVAPFGICIGTRRPFSRSLICSNASFSSDVDAD
jgi:hypothetical protein